MSTDEYHKRHHKTYWPTRGRHVQQAKLYGTTPEAIKALREKYTSCVICGKTNVLLDIDHDHATGKIRGLLCRKCNTRLASLEDLPWRRKAEAYLASFK